LYVSDLSYCVSDRKGETYSHGGRLGGSAAEGNGALDVEHGLGAARRPDGGGNIDLVLLEVVGRDGAGELHLAIQVLVETREVVLRRGNTGHGLLGNVDVAAVVSLEDTKLEALRDGHLDVDLAHGAALGRRHVGAGLGNVLVEDERDDRLVLRDGLANRALGAARATILHIDELDIVGARHISPLLKVKGCARGQGRDEASGADSSEDEGSEVHFEVCVCVKLKAYCFVVCWC